MTRTFSRFRPWILTSSSLVLLLSAGCFDPSDPTPAGETSTSTTDGLVSTGSSDGPASSGNGSDTGTVETQTSGMPLTTGNSEDDGTGPGTTSGPTSGAEPCTEACVPEAAEAPYIVLSGEAGADLSCPDGWGADPSLLHRDLNIPDSTCSCSCGSADGFTCPSAEVENHFDGGCTNFSETTLLPVDECVNLFAFSNLPEFTTTPTEVSCPAVEASDIPPTTWASDVLLCRAETTGSGCEADETCVPPPPADADVCTVLEGDVSCPEGPYSDRSVVYGNVDDGRSCSPACACEGSGTCGPTLEIWDNEGCVGAADTVIAFETCTNSPAASARYTTQLFSPGCEPNDPAPAGTAEPSAPQTLCCVP